MSEANKAVVRRWIAGWNERGANAVDELFAPTFTDQQLARAIGGSVTLDGLKAWLRALEGALGRGQFVEQEMVAEGDRVVVRWTVEGTHQGPYLGLPATGKSFRVDGVNIFRVVEGLITERWSFVDVPALIAQLGGRVVPVDPP